MQNKTLVQDSRALSVADQRRLKEIIKILRREYPDAQCSLDFRTPFQLLVATILASQCTDTRVNKVTPALFKKFPTPASMAKATLPALESLIRSTGFFKNKAIALKATSRILAEEYGGKVPQEMEHLLRLKGVGRKTANVVLGNCYGIPGIVVDTHVGRLSRRMGLTQHEDPKKVELDLMEHVPKTEWTEFSHLLVFHGRAVCDARRPRCEECQVAKFCPKIGVMPKSSGFKPVE